MGTSFFGGKGGAHGFNQKPTSVRMSEPNMAARAFSAPGYAGKAAGMQSRKDLGAAAAAAQHDMGGPVKKSAATDAPGPKV